MLEGFAALEADPGDAQGTDMIHPLPQISHRWVRN
ncbi:hypothetical protein BH18VER2_BH18VER2_06120 [soil metagenome]